MMKIPHLEHLAELPTLMNDMDVRLMGIEDALKDDVVGILGEILVQLKRANGQNA